MKFNQYNTIVTCPSFICDSPLLYTDYLINNKNQYLYSVQTEIKFKRKIIQLRIDKSKWTLLITDN